MDKQQGLHSLGVKPRLYYGYVVVIAAFIIQIVMYGPRASYGVFFKPILTEFGWSRALVSGAFSIGTIAQGISGVIMGGLNDKLGPRVVMSMCGAFLGVGYLLMSRINAPWQLYMFYVLIVGAGMGGIFAPVFSTVARWFSKRRGMMTGIVIAGGGTGGIIVPPVINWLITSYGWRYAYIIMGSAVLVIIIGAAQFLKRDPARIGLYPDGEKNLLPPEPVFATKGLSIEEAVRTRQYWMMVSMVACLGFGVMTVVIHVVPRVTDLGISSTLASSVLAVMGFSLVTGGVVFGLVADRIGTRKTYMICFSLMAVALFWLMTAGEMWMFYLIAVIVGLANGCGSTLESPFVAELFGMKSHGLLLGTSEFCFTIGAASGPFIAGYLFDVTGSYRQAFMVGAILALIGLVMAATLRPAMQR